MPSTAFRELPGGPGWRERPAGLVTGRGDARVNGAAGALLLVSEELLAAERALSELIQSDVAAVPVVAGHLVAAGGKRLRPALCALSFRALDLPIRHRLLCVGELIHLGSLLHDDVVDASDTRRGRPAAHRWYGSAVAVLSGDFCLARAVLLAAEEGGHRAVTELARAVTEMAEGEVLQLQRAGDLSTTRAAYLEVIDRKSAALIAWCAAAPAWSAGRDDDAEALARFGRGVGAAFQVTDDVLDYASDTGKPPGQDLRQRKVTLPLLFAMEADPGLRDLLVAGAPSEADVPALVHRVRRTGALDAALDAAREMVADAVDALSILPDNEGRDALIALGRHLVDRVR